MKLVIMSKAKKLPEGTIRTHGGKKVIKKNGKWMPYREQKGSKKKEGSESRPYKARAKAILEIADAPRAEVRKLFLEADKQGHPVDADALELTATRFADAADAASGDIGEKAYKYAEDRYDAGNPIPDFPYETESGVAVFHLGKVYCTNSGEIEAFSRAEVAKIISADGDWVPVEGGDEYRMSEDSPDTITNEEVDYVLPNKEGALKWAKGARTK